MYRPNPLSPNVQAALLAGGISLAVGLVLTFVQLSASRPTSGTTGPGVIPIRNNTDDELWFCWLVFLEKYAANCSGQIPPKPWIKAAVGKKSAMTELAELLSTSSAIADDVQTALAAPTSAGTPALDGCPLEPIAAPMVKYVTETVVVSGTTVYLTDLSRVVLEAPVNYAQGALVGWRASFNPTGSEWMAMIRDSKDAVLAVAKTGIDKYKRV